MCCISYHTEHLIKRDVTLKCEVVLFTGLAALALCLSGCLSTSPPVMLELPTASPVPSATDTPTATITPTSSPARSSTSTPTAVESTGLPAFKHIFLIVMENKEEDRIIGNSHAPYFNQLAEQYASAANYYGITHPSLPNYLALIGGDTFGINSDCVKCYVDGDNLATQLAEAGRSWKAYIESMPNPCFIGDDRALYAQKHNPFIYFDSVRTNPELCNQVVPLPELSADLEQNNLPDFVWITPDMCNSMHDCAIEVGDSWLQSWVPQITASDAWKDQSVLFITFDEGDTFDGCCIYAHGGHILMLVVSPLVKPGFVSPVEYNHYSLLRTIETAWDLPLLGHADCDCTATMDDFFTTP